MRYILPILLCCLPSFAQAGSAIFFHPDGMGGNTWSVVRAVKVGPDADLAWDKLPHVAVYKGHISDGITASSNGGATIHAYGEKAPREAYGLMDESKQSIAHQALAAGKAVGLINSGSIIEPGTAAFVARVNRRSEREKIAAQVIHSGTQLILSGGEEWLLPKGMTGRHGPGKRTDGRNLLEDAKKLNYHIVYNAAELAAVDVATTPKLLGVFAKGHIFNEEGSLSPRERAGDEGLSSNANQRSAPLPNPLPKGEGTTPLFTPGAPTIAEMTAKGLQILQHHAADNFLLVAEEEGTDNFANKGNITGQIEAGKRADDAIGVINQFMVKHANSTLLVTSDSDASGLQIVDCGQSLSSFFRLKACKDGSSFISQPDARGKRFTFNALTIGTSDVAGGIVIRAGGKHAHNVGGTMDNTAIYHQLKAALFAAD